MSPNEWLTVVEPVPEAIEAMLDQVFRCSKVEPWIDCERLVSIDSSVSSKPVQEAHTHIHV